MEYKNIFKTAFGFKGRMTRKPFWIALTINLIIACGLIALFAKATQTQYVYPPQRSIAPFFICAGLLVVLINHLALVSKRFHDV